MRTTSLSATLNAASSSRTGIAPPGTSDTSGYYRLSPYTIPFQTDRTTHSFSPGTTFDDILYIYVFDRQLRLLTTDALERVEVAVRAAVSNTMSTQGEGGAFWYRNLSSYQSRKDHSATVEHIEHLTELGRQCAPSTRREQTAPFTILMRSPTTSTPTHPRQHRHPGWSSSSSPPASFIIFKLT